MLNTRTTLDKALKYIYEPGMNFALINNTVAFSAFTKRKFPGVGKAYVFATHLKRNEYVAARKHDGYYAPTGTETPENGSVVPSYVHIGFEITNDVIKASKGDKAAFKDGMKMAMDTSRDTLQTHLNRMFLGDGTGIICDVATFGGGAGTQTLTIKSTSTYSTKMLRQGMPLDFWNANTRVNGGAGELPTDWAVVQSVLSDTTFSVAMYGGGSVPAIADGSYVITMGNAWVNSGTRACLEPNGLRLFADDGTLDPTSGLHGISGTSYDAWQAIIKNAQGADAGPGLASAMAISYMQKSPFKFNMIWVHPQQQHGLIYGNDGSYKDKRFVNGSVTDIGDNMEAVVINVAGRKIKVQADWFINETEMTFLDSAQMRYVELNGVELEEQADGQYMTPWRDSTGAKPAQVGYWMFRGNWAIVARNAIARAYGLSKPSSMPW